MRVGLLIYGDLNILSGGYLYNRKLVTYLQQQGDTVEIISLQQRSYTQHLLDNINPVQFQKLDIDILIQDELVHPSIFRTNRKLKKLHYLPIVSLVHLFSSYAQQPFYKKTIYRYIERKYLQTIDGLILNSENTLSQARNLLGCELPPHVIAVPAGDHFPDYINTRGKPDKNKAGPGPLRILIVGSVINQKGLHVIIQTMARLQSRDYILTVTGRLDMEPAYVKKIRKLIRTLKLENQVTITGPLQNDKLIEVYQSNDIFILPSVNEAYGIVYLEAQQFGLPIIGTTAGGAKEIIKHGENGYLMSPNDGDQLAAYLKLLHDDSALRKKLSDNALRAYQQHPGWDDTGHSIRKFLQELISKAGCNGE